MRGLALAVLLVAGAIAVAVQFEPEPTRFTPLDMSADPPPNEVWLGSMRCVCAEDAP